MIGLVQMFVAAGEEQIRQAEAIFCNTTSEALVVVPVIQCSIATNFALMVPYTSESMVSALHPQRARAIQATAIRSDRQRKLK